MIRAQEERLPRGLQWLDDYGIVFRGSTATRISFGVVALIFASCVPLNVWAVCSEPRLFQGWPIEGLLLFTFSAMSVLFWYAAGPRETAFDLRRQTYRLTTGFPLTPRVQHGAFDEFAGVFVRKSIRTNSTAPPPYWVYLVWNQPRRQDVLLLGHSDPEVAERIMCRTAAALGVSAGGKALDRLWFRNPRLRRCDNQALFFHKPPGVRLAWGITGKAIAIASLIVSGALVVTSHGLHLQAETTSLGIVLMDIAGLLCLRAAGPEDLEVDLQNRTYRCRYGFPYLSVERRGQIEDIVALKTDNQGNSGAVRVRLVWAQPRRGDMTLGEFRSREEADAHLRGVAARLGLRSD